MRGAGCIKKALFDEAGEEIVAVPVRGAGCIVCGQTTMLLLAVAVPVRGAGCIRA